MEGWDSHWEWEFWEGIHSWAGIPRESLDTWERPRENWKNLKERIPEFPQGILGILLLPGGIWVRIGIGIGVRIRIGVRIWIGIRIRIGIRIGVGIGIGIRIGIGIGIGIGIKIGIGIRIHLIEVGMPGHVKDVHLDLPIPDLHPGKTIGILGIPGSPSSGKTLGDPGVWEFPVPICIHRSCIHTDLNPWIPWEKPFPGGNDSQNPP